MTRHYRIGADYIGGFDGVAPPEGAIECPAPDHAGQKWTGSEWGPVPTPTPTIPEQIDALLTAMVETGALTVTRANSIRTKLTRVWT